MFFAFLRIVAKIVKLVEPNEKAAKDGLRSDFLNKRAEFMKQTSSGVIAYENEASANSGPTVLFPQ